MDLRTKIERALSAANNHPRWTHAGSWEWTLAFLRALESEGLKLMDGEVTEKMNERAGDMIEREYGESDWEEAKDMAEMLNPRPIWDAMFAAAPMLADRLKEEK